MSQSASHSLHLVSLSSLCSAAFSACLSLRLVTAISSLSGLLFHLLAFLFASPHCGLPTLCSAVSCLSLRLVSLSSLCSAVSFACLKFLFALQPCALGLTPLLLLDYYTLHEHRSHSLRFERHHHHHHRRPPIVKIRCTPHYMGLAQARPNDLSTNYYY